MQELHNKQKLFAYIRWQVWKARNAWCFGAKNLAEREIIQKACKEWMELKNEQPKVKRTEGNRILITRQSYWQQLESVVIKLNTNSEC